MPVPHARRVVERDPLLAQDAVVAGGDQVEGREGGGGGVGAGGTGVAAAAAKEAAEQAAAVLPVVVLLMLSRRRRAVVGARGRGAGSLPHVGDGHHAPGHDDGSGVGVPAAAPAAAGRGGQRLDDELVLHLLGSQLQHVPSRGPAVGLDGRAGAVGEGPARGTQAQGEGRRGGVEVAAVVAATAPDRAPSPRPPAPPPPAPTSSSALDRRSAHASLLAVTLMTAVRVTSGLKPSVGRAAASESSQASVGPAGGRAAKASSPSPPPSPTVPTCLSSRPSKPNAALSEEHPSAKKRRGRGLALARGREADLPAPLVGEEAGPGLVPAEAHRRRRGGLGGGGGRGGRGGGGVDRGRGAGRRGRGHRGGGRT